MAPFATNVCSDSPRDQRSKCVTVCDSLVTACRHLSCLAWCLEAAVIAALLSNVQQAAMLCLWQYIELLQQSSAAVSTLFRHMVCLLQEVAAAALAARQCNTDTVSTVSAPDTSAKSCLPVHQAPFLSVQPWLAIFLKLLRMLDG